MFFLFPQDSPNIKTGWPLYSCMVSQQLHLQLHLCFTMHWRALYTLRPPRYYKYCYCYLVIDKLSLRSLKKNKSKSHLLFFTCPIPSLLCPSFFLRPLTGQQHQMLWTAMFSTHVLDGCRSDSAWSGCVAFTSKDTSLNLDA